MKAEVRFIRRDACPRENCTYELNPECCGEGESMTDEHECIYVSGCCSSQPSSGTDLISSPNGPPVGFCGACGEAFSFSCEDIANDACPVEREVG